MNAVEMPVREQEIKGGAFWLIVLLAAWRRGGLGAVGASPERQEVECLVS